MTTTVSQEAREAAVKLFDAILGNMASYAEWGTPSYREAALREIEQSIRHQAERGEAWRPIETAPKDGTVIDLWKLAPDGRHGKRIPDIKWDANRSFNGGIGRVAMSDAWVHADHGGEVWLDGGSFTHWQPLPTPPEAV